MFIPLQKPLPQEDVIAIAKVLFNITTEYENSDMVYLTNDIINAMHLDDKHEQYQKVLDKIFTVDIFTPADKVLFIRKIVRAGVFISYSKHPIFEKLIMDFYPVISTARIYGEEQKWG